MTIRIDNGEIPRRLGEVDLPITSRNNRFFKQGSGWYFNTREGNNHGPFKSRILAHEGIQKYIREKQFLV